MFSLIEGKTFDDVECVILGSGRFIRSVLVPALQGGVIIVQ